MKTIIGIMQIMVFILLCSCARIEQVDQDSPRPHSTLRLSTEEARTVAATGAGITTALGSDNPFFSEMEALRIAEDTFELTEDPIAVKLARIDGDSAGRARGSPHRPGLVWIAHIEDLGRPLPSCQEINPKEPSNTSLVEFVQTPGASLVISSTDGTVAGAFAALCEIKPHGVAVFEFWIDDYRYAIAGGSLSPFEFLKEDLCDNGGSCAPRGGEYAGTLSTGSANVIRPRTEVWSGGVLVESF
jgi:hypothetical protein